MMGAAVCHAAIACKQEHETNLEKIETCSDKEKKWKL